MLERVATFYSKGSSQPRNRTLVSCISCIGRWVLYRPRKPQGLLQKKTFLRGGGWRKEFAPPYTTLVGKFTLTDYDAVGIYRAIKDSDSGKGLSARLSLMPRTLTCLEKRFVTKLLLAVFF